MKIESYGPTLADASKQLTPVNSSQTAKSQENHSSAALDKTTLSSVATATDNKSTVSIPAAPVEDKTTLSSTPAAVHALTQSALQTEASREAKVANLKQEVNSAQYKLDAAKIAEALSNGGF